jgi:peptidyl-prolyl cis-trans isomerase C
MLSMAPSSRKRFAARLAAGLGLFCGLAAAGSAPLGSVAGQPISVTELGRAARALGAARERDGASWPEQRRRLLEELIVPRALLRAALRRNRLEHTAAVQQGRDELLQGALLSALARQLDAGIGEADVRAFYAEHAAEYREPEGILIWRLLAKDEKTARELLERAKSLDVAAWSQLVREHSLDPATNMRAGNLGYVYADGQTERPQLRVDARLFAAAQKVKDGKLVLEPVAEGDHFAVVWRRASRSASEQRLEGVRESIRIILLEQRLDAERTRLLGSLRERALSEYHPELLEEWSPEEPSLTPRPERASGAERPAATKAQPSARGLR